MSDNNPYASPVSNLTGDRSDAPSAVTALTVELLRKTKPWVRLISIVLFISAAFMILGGVMMALIGSSLSSVSGRPDPFGEGGARVVGVVYFVMGFLYFYPGIKLFKYASRISELMSSGRPEDLESALTEQMAFWRFSGIITLVFVVVFGFIFGLAMLGAVVGAVSAG